MSDNSSAVPVQQSDQGAIKTADISQLVESSKEKLVENLNRRAGSFNPAWLVYVLAVLAILGAISVLSQGPEANSVPTLPATDNLGSSVRQQNDADEYALMVARYGQPNTVDELPSAGNLTVRKATYEAAHLSILFVPNGCVDTYTFDQSHQDNTRKSRIHAPGRHSAKQDKPPVCKPSQNDGSTIVGYIDSQTNAPADSTTAQSSLGLITTPRMNPPSISGPADDQEHRGRSALKSKEQAPNELKFDHSALQGELNRLDQLRNRAAQVSRDGVVILMIGLILFFAGISTHIWCRRRRTTTVVYSEEAAAEAQPIDSVFGDLMRCHALWRVTSDVRQYDWKRHAGAGRSIDRYKITAQRSQPPYVKSNVVPTALNMGSVRLYFLPDTILYWQNGQFASVGYNDLTLTCHQTRFIEDGYAPADATVVGKTWRYVRKDGGPDRRFNNNRELPIALYGVLILNTSTGVNLVLETSASDAAATFRWKFEELRSKRFTGTQKTSGFQSPASADARSESLRILGLDSDAPAEKITEAYHRLAQLYHPDKVAGLGPELRELSERKMKEINSAYQTLVK